MSTSKKKDWKTHLQANLPEFPKYLGIELTEATPDRLLAEAIVRPNLSIETDTLLGDRRYARRYCHHR